MGLGQRKRHVDWTLVGGRPESVVWVDVLALEAAWRGSDGYVGPHGAGSLHEGRYARVDQYIRSHERLHYPHLSLDGDVPIFTDGRHRFAWLRDHGATAVAITASPPADARLQALFGSRERETSFQV